MRDHAVPIVIVVALMTCIPSLGGSQSPRPKLDGMWSDPPANVLGTFCADACTDAGIDRLNALLDNPANDARPFDELQAEAKTREREYIRSRLTDSALKTYPLDPADDPGFLRCEPWGLARQMFARHQLEIRQRGNDRLELRYGEWDARRTIYMDGGTSSGNRAPGPMGHSVGRWEGDTLVIETSGVAANIAWWPTRHSDELRVVERYSRASDGTLQLAATLADPLTLREPVVVKKIWRWAPEQKITAYKDCERPTEFKRGTRQP